MGERTDTTIAIIGAGFAGLGMAIRLREEGIDDFVVLERAGDLGGTWRDNHYPGLCCDIPSHVYSYSFELNPGWTRGFAPGWEIQSYLKRTAEKHGVLPHLRYDHEVLDARWDEDRRLWRIETAGGDFTARILISAAGGLSEPSIPDLPGLDRFEGKVFHSAHWDHDHDLRGRNVAVVGTGASAIQFVPRIQPRVGRLSLFQRTPPWVVPRLDHEITDVEHTLLRRIPFAPRVVRWFLYWLMELRIVLFRRPRLMRIGDRLARKHLARQVRDPELRARLTPDYVMGCKRVLISDDYYPSLTQSNVDVVTSGIEEIRPGSIVDGDGEEREVDTIILGTGFRVTDLPITHRIRGPHGRTLAEHWGGSMQAYLGSAIAGFPNFFMLVGPNTGLGHNSIVFMIEAQVNYVAGALRAMRRRGADRLEVRSDVQDRFNEELQQAMKGTVWTAGRCQSWYLDDSGRNTTLWPGWTVGFHRRTRRFDADAYEMAGGRALVKG
jgi:cation diffusion facilitator CzcD-associated flavoprotein CzcO